MMEQILLKDERRGHKNVGNLEDWLILSVKYELYGTRPCSISNYYYYNMKNIVMQLER